MADTSVVGEIERLGEVMVACSLKLILSNTTILQFFVTPHPPFSVLSLLSLFSFHKFRFFLFYSFSTFAESPHLFWDFFLHIHLCVLVSCCLCAPYYEG